MPIPPNPAFGIGVGWIVRALFRFDSTTDGGNLAFISMRGAVEDPGVGTAKNNQASGTVSGSMVVNRRRGWLSESRFVVQMLSTILSADAAGKSQPVQLRLRISQHMRVADKR